jgi:hypothetical protein
LNIDYATPLLRHYAITPLILLLLFFILIHYYAYYLFSHIDAIAFHYAIIDAIAIISLRRFHYAITPLAITPLAELVFDISSPLFIAMPMPLH